MKPAALPVVKSLKGAAQEPVAVPGLPEEPLEIVVLEDIGGGIDQECAAVG